MSCEQDREAEAAGYSGLWSYSRVTSTGTQVYKPYYTIPVDTAFHLALCHARFIDVHVPEMIEN